VIEAIPKAWSAVRRLRIRILDTFQEVLGNTFRQELFANQSMISRCGSSG
jgi:hypothetical protein